MAILFLLALVLAWPTYGLSVLAWVVIAIVMAKSKANRAVDRETRKIYIEPLFTGRFADFFRALDVPTRGATVVSEAHAHQCGRHIMNYVAHNPAEGAEFMRGLEKWRTKGDPQPCHPVVAAGDEVRFNQRGAIHLVSWRAIEAVMTNNPGLECFRDIDLAGVKKRLDRFQQG